MRFAAILHRIGALAAGADGYDTVLIGLEIMGRACDVMDALLQSPAISGRDLAPWMEAEFSPAYAPDPGRPFDQGERLRILAPVQDGFLRHTLPGEPTVVISRINEAFDRISSVARLPSWSDEQREYSAYIETETSTSHVLGSYGHHLGTLRLMIGGPFLRREVVTTAMAQIVLAEVRDLIGISRLMRQLTVRLELIQVALCIRQQTHPGKLPPDPFSNGPIQVERDATSWKIWSVGSDVVRNGSSTRGEVMALTIPILDQSRSIPP